MKLIEKSDSVGSFLIPYNPHDFDVKLSYFTLVYFTRHVMKNIESTLLAFARNFIFRNLDLGISLQEATEDSLKSEKRKLQREVCFFFCVLLRSFFADLQ